MDNWRVKGFQTCTPMCSLLNLAPNETKLASLSRITKLTDPHHKLPPNGSYPEHPLQLRALLAPLKAAASHAWRK